MNAPVSRETLPDPTAAQRQRRWYKRHKTDALFAYFDIPYSLAAALIESGYLTEADSFEPHKRGEALVRYVVAQRKTKLP